MTDLRSDTLSTLPARTAVSAGPAPADTGRTAWRTASAGIAAIAVGTLGILALHVLPETSVTSPLRRTISEYAYSSLGWVFDGGVVLISIGSLLVLAGLISARLIGRFSVGSLALLAWSVALVVLVVFPKHDWSVGPSTHGAIHRAASLVAFLSVPIAALVIGIRHRRRVAGKWTIASGVLSAGFLSLILGAFVLTPLTGTPWYRAFPLGLTERGIAVFAIMAVLSMAFLVRERRAALETGAEPADRG